MMLRPAFISGLVAGVVFAGKDEVTAVRDDVKVLEARMQHWKATVYRPH
jgi:hypothetical protein